MDQLASWRDVSSIRSLLYRGDDAEGGRVGGGHFQEKMPIKNTFEDKDESQRF